MTPSLDSALAQCKATIWAGPDSYHCSSDMSHEGWHRFMVDQEGLDILARVRAAEKEKEAALEIAERTAKAWEAECQDADVNLMDLRAALAEFVESNQARERILNEYGLDMLRLEHDLAKRTTDLENLRAQGAVQVQVDRQTIDALRAERERLRETINAYRRSLAQGLICLVGKPCADTSRDHRHWSQAEYDALHMMLGAALAPEAEREKKP
jgi:hypothetical protein